MASRPFCTATTQNMSGINTGLECGGPSDIFQERFNPNWPLRNLGRKFLTPLPASLEMGVFAGGARCVLLVVVVSWWLWMVAEINTKLCQWAQWKSFKSCSVGEIYDWYDIIYRRWKLLWEKCTRKKSETDRPSYGHWVMVFWLGVGSSGCLGVLGGTGGDWWGTGVVLGRATVTNLASAPNSHQPTLLAKVGNYYPGKSLYQHE